MCKDRGLLNFEDFVRLAARWGLKADMEMERELEVAMSTLDKEGTGYVDATRFKEMMKNLGEPIPDDEIKEILKLCDVRPDGKFAIFCKFDKKVDEHLLLTYVRYSYYGTNNGLCIIYIQLILGMGLRFMKIQSVISGYGFTSYTRS